MACCGRKKHNDKIGKTEMEVLKEKFRFNENELLEFKRRFSYLTKDQKLLDKETFRENMGLLGLDAGSFLADRIFAALDVDKDGKIRLEEYLKYFDILIYGSPAEKHTLTFRMIDLDSNGWFTFNEFKTMILSMLYTWNNLTGSHYNINQNEKLDEFLNIVFRRFDIEGTGKVSAESFSKVVTAEPDLLDIFNHFNQGIIDSVQPNELDEKDKAIIDELEHLHNKINQLKAFIGCRIEAHDVPVEQREGETHKADSGSPIELKTPIVSYLDSKIKGTIFFEPFRAASLQPMRQRSDADKVSKDSDLYRRWSHQPKLSQQSNFFEKNEEKKSSTHDKPERFKSVEVIYQEGNSSTSIPAMRGTNYSLFKKERVDEEQKKSEAETAKYGYEPPFGLSPEKPILKPQREEYISVEIGSFQGNNVQEMHAPHRMNRSIHDEQHIGNTTHPDQKDGDESMPSPGGRKLQLKPLSAPIEAKILDRESEIPEPSSVAFSKPGTSTVAPPRKAYARDLDVDVTKSVYIGNRSEENEQAMAPVENGVRIPDAQKLENGGDIYLQVQQVTEQLETLATETLKIIEEIRNKKRTNEPVEEIDGAQKKATVQNVHKMPAKDKKGNYVLFGHQNWNLVLNMMLGIQMAVKSHVENSTPLTKKDFSLKYIFELVPKRTGETKDSFKICTFFDYAPAVFFELKRLFGIKNEDYLRSIGPEAMLGNLIKGNLSSLSELTSTGKSGSFFYYSSDGKYTLKTISRDEFHFLRIILTNYYTHLVNNPETLIIKFFGLHKIRFMKKNRSKEKVYFVIMANVFHTTKEIHVRYDLKGSTKGRYTKESDPSVAKKDMNIITSKEKILLPLYMAPSFVDIIEKDSKFFEENGIIDYSLLMGIHFLNQEEINTRESTGQKKSIYESKINGREGILSSDGTKLYFFGIIDILTEYNAKKKAEYVVKRLAYGKGISAVPPAMYAARFRKFIKSLVAQPEGNA